MGGIQGFAGERVAHLDFRTADSAVTTAANDAFPMCLPELKAGNTQVVTA